MSSRNLCSLAFRDNLPAVFQLRPIHIPPIQSIGQDNVQAPRRFSGVAQLRITINIIKFLTFQIVVIRKDTVKSSNGFLVSCFCFWAQQASSFEILFILFRHVGMLCNCTQYQSSLFYSCNKVLN